jgi:hypothetical protein
LACHAPRDAVKTDDGSGSAPVAPHCAAQTCGANFQQEPTVNLRSLLFAALILAMAAACVSAGGSENAALQDTVGLMVSIGQHGEGVDVSEAAASLDEKVAVAPNDPYVLKVAAMTRASLANKAPDRATRVKLRQDALAQFDRAISLAKPNAPPRTVMMNGQPMDIDLGDLAGLRADFFATVQTDR